MARASRSFSWRAGAAHPLRFINITRHDIVSVTLMSAAGPLSWRPLTKDGLQSVKPLISSMTPRRGVQGRAVLE